jgi:hypothetical protein
MSEAFLLRKDKNNLQNSISRCIFAEENEKGIQMMEQRPKYPVGEQSFENIRLDGAVYVDKTGLIYKLTHTYRTVFLSRPRRFGKSLLADTMACYFEAQKELFKGLAMEQLETEWTKYPVLRFNFGDVKGFNMYELKRTIEQQLKRYEKIYGADPLDTTPSTRFSGLIERAYEQTGQQVVILIDEYDAPLLEVLMMPEMLDEVRNYMRNFYSRIKTNYRYIHFAFMTGISTFSQLGMFSELNNLRNITNDNEYASICGITLPELKENFRYGIRKFAEQESCTPEEMVEKLREQYDGYHFTKSMVDVFNPYSLLNAFTDCELNSYWFQTGTPTLAINMLKAHKEDWVFNMENIEALPPMSQEDFSTPLENATDPIPVLYQAGYLTIKSYDREYNNYVLGVPNTEVRIGLMKNLIPIYSSLSAKDAANTAKNVSVALSKGDYECAMGFIQSFLSGIPFLPGDREVLGDVVKCEAYYHKVFYVIVAMLNNGARGQVRLALGVPDIVIETRKYIYVIELKINSTPQVALRQLEEMNYALPFAMDGRELVKLGVNFSTEARTIDAWERG